MLAASIAAPAAAVQTSASVARVAAARAPASEASRLRALRSASRVAVGATIAAVARIHERRVCRDSGRRTSCQSTAVRCKVDSVSTAEDVAWKFDLVRSVGEECQTERELRRLLEKKPDFVLYDGFEPSGRMHIAQGIFKSIAVNKCTKAGGLFTFWVADWFALMNDKMGGDEEKIRVVGEYLIEVWKASGMDMSRVKFLWSSEEISMRAEEYWSQAIDIASRVTLARVKKCCQIMGRKENSLTAAQILYPIMQCTDIFFLKADICQLGVDQRKVNMLARDYCDLAGRKLKPVILSHHMLFGLKAGQAKMSKSDPDSAIFMEDSVEDVERKIAQAYCPSKPEAASSSKSEEEEEMHLVEDALKNPCLDYIEHILFQQPEYRFEVDGQSFDSFQAVKDSFVAGSLTEAALKSRLVDDINSLLEPVREHFRKDARAKELLAKVTEWRRETLTPTTSLTRLDLSSEEEKPRFIVFAPTPTHRLSLESVLHIIDCFKQAPETLQPVLWLDDWSSRSLGCLGSLPVNMASFYEVLLHALRELAPDLMESVQVLRQSEAILSGPSAYWTSIINIGRQHSVEQLGEALLGQDEQLEAAGQVVASLMHVGDVLALSGHSGTVLCGAPASEGMHSLAAEYVGSCGLPKPEVQLIEPRSLWLKDTHEALAAATEEDGQLLVTDQEVDVNRKIKKAFAEPQNVELCPLLTWVDVLLDTGGGDGFLISRKPANGGNKTYEDQEAVRSDFASGDLHPGDLKPAVSKSINALLGSVRKGFKSNADVKRAVQKLNAYGKALRKKKAR